jgi:hypothetical protein
MNQRRRHIRMVSHFLRSGNHSTTSNPLPRPSIRELQSDDGTGFPALLIGPSPSNLRNIGSQTLLNHSGYNDGDFHRRMPITPPFPSIPE